MDSGSTQTMMSKRFASKLNLKGTKRLISFVVAGGNENKEESKYYDIDITSVDKTKEVYNVGCYELKQPCAPASQISKDLLLQQEHLRHIIPQIYCEGGKVDILIGTDLPVAHVDIQTISGGSNDLTAKRSVFGWTIVGKFPGSNQKQSTITINSIFKTDNVEFNLAKYFETEAIGIKPSQECVCTDNEKTESAFIRHVQQYTSRAEDGRIEIKMPWKKGHPSLPNNRPAAEKRLIQLEKKLSKSSQKLEQYNKEIELLVEMGFVKKLCKEEVNLDGPAWYLPHQAVEKPERETTKLRLVFDSAAQYKGICLNDALEKGPNLINDLLQVFLGWREDVIGITGDISKMFNQVLVHPDDQKYHRFLWRNGQSNREPDVYQWVRLSFGDKPAPDLAGWAIKLLAMENSIKHEEAAFVLKKRIYVDDIGHSVKSDKQGETVTSDLDVVLGTGQFEIKAWNSNCKSLDKTGKDKCEILGHTWNKNEDTFQLKIREAIRLQTITKRAILSCIAKVWDPIGLLSPFTIQHKIQMQNLWTRGLEWDAILPEDEHTFWQNLIDSLNTVMNCQMDRSLKPVNAIGSPQLHGFSDGGEQAYGCCVFLRWQLNDNSYECCFVAGKAFVTPLKRKTIPRIELMGCQILTRLVNTIESALTTKLSSKIFWCNSTTAMKWIHSNPRNFKPFVGTRIAEIQETYDPALWCYVPSGLNPSDALTKGVAKEELEEWYKGPPFLYLNEDKWPEVEQPTDNVPYKDELELLELKKKSNITANAIDTTSSDVIQKLLKISSFHKIKRTVAIWRRFIDNCQGPKKDIIKEPLTAQELKDAENIVFKLSQSDIDFTDKKYEKVLPFQDVDTGVWKANGRMEVDDKLSYDQCYCQKIMKSLSVCYEIYN